MLKPNRKHAIVIGGSMAGLLATRVLSDRFERVTLVERDSFPSVGEHRRGVPQGRHTHGLLASGRQVLDTLFPGISEQLMDGGALQGDVSDGCRWLFEGDRLKQSELGIQGLLMTRPFLEGVVRERVLALANVERCDDAHVERLTTTDDRGRVTGVEFANGNLPGDFVLDATGRGSRSPRWLEELGYPTPREERIEVELRYTTRFFRRSQDDLDGDGGPSRSSATSAIMRRLTYRASLTTRLRCPAQIFTSSSGMPSRSEKRLRPSFRPVCAGDTKSSRGFPRATS